MAFREFNAAIGDVDGVVKSAGYYVGIRKADCFTIGSISYISMQDEVPATGDTVTILNGVRGIYINPAALLDTLTILTPESAFDGVEILILFGGTINGANNPVVTALTFSANSGTELVGTFPTTATTDTVIKIKFRGSLGQWYRIDATTSNVPIWVKVATLSFSDFSVVGNTKTIASGYSLPIKGIVMGTQIKATTAFSGGILLDYQIEIGDAIVGTNAYLNSTSVFTGSTQAYSGWNAPVGYISFTTTTPITVTATSIGDTLNNATDGSLDIYLLIQILP